MTGITTASSNVTLRQKECEIRRGDRVRIETRWCQSSPAEWKGHVVNVDDPPEGDVCPAFAHELEVVHHYEECEHGHLIHVCPTGFLMCSKCCGFAIEPEPHECQRHGW